MAVTMKIAVPGGEMQITGNNDKEIFRKAAFWQSLPTTCPIDGSPTRLEFRSPQDYEYYMVVSTGEFQYEYKMGIHNNQEKTLFNKGKWTYYDPEAVDEKSGRKGAEVIVAEYGKVYKDRLPRKGLGSRPSPSTTSAPEDAQQPQGDEGIGRSEQAEQNENLQKARKWAVKVLNDAGVPEKMRGAILTSMLGRPVQNDINRLSLQDASELRKFLKNIPDGIENALEDLKENDSEAAAFDGSDLDEDFPDFMD